MCYVDFDNFHMLDSSIQKCSVLSEFRFGFYHQTYGLCDLFEKLFNNAILLTQSIIIVVLQRILIRINISNKAVGYYCPQLVGQMCCDLSSFSPFK